MTARGRSSASPGLSRAMQCLCWSLCSALALSAAASAGDRRVQEWRAPANRARLSIEWVEPAAVSGEATPPWPFLLYVHGVPTKRSARIERDILADTEVVLAARVCRLVRITPDEAASLPYMKQLPRIGDPMLVVVGRDFRMHGALLDRRRLDAASCLDLMANAVDAASEVPLREYLSSYLDILEDSEKAWRDEQRFAADGKGEVAQAVDLDARREEIASAQRALAARECALLQRMRVHVVNEVPTESGVALTPAEAEALRSYREHAHRANPVDAAYALAALRGYDSAAMASAIVKEAARSSWSTWKAGEVLAAMRSPGATRAIRDALSQRGPSRAAALAAAARRPIPECEGALLALAEDRDAAVRADAVGALGAQRGPAALQALVKALDDPDAGVRVLATRGLGGLGGAEHVPALEARLRDPDWCVRRAAAAALATLRVKESVPTLLDYLASGEGALREDALAGLVRLTGKTLGFHPAGWRAWWTDAGAAFAPSAKIPPGSAFDDAVRGFEWPVSCGPIGTLSDRVVFVVDTGVEMGRRPDIPPDTPEPERQRLSAGTKLDRVKADVVSALGRLDRDAFFNVLAFAGKVKRWRDAPARGSAAKAAVAWARDLKARALPPVGSRQSLRGSSTRSNPANPYLFRTGEHDVCSAVLAAMGIDGSDPLADRSRPPYDTVFLVVDGNPAGGAVQQIPHIAEIVAELNRSRGVVIHVVTFSDAMRNAYAGIAEATGGRHASYGS